jgi:anti-anti-sigma factor
VQVPLQVLFMRGARSVGGLAGIWRVWSDPNDQPGPLDLHRLTRPFTTGATWLGTGGGDPWEIPGAEEFYDRVVSDQRFSGRSRAGRQSMSSYAPARSTAMPAFPTDRSTGVDISTEQNGDLVVVVPHGDLDDRVADAVEREIASLVARGFAHVVLDVRDLFFVGSSGMELLARLEADAHTDGYTFHVRAGTGANRACNRRRFERVSSERSL